MSSLNDAELLVETPQLYLRPIAVLVRFVSYVLPHPVVHTQEPHSHTESALYQNLYRSSIIPESV